MGLNKQTKKNGKIISAVCIGACFIVFGLTYHKIYVTQLGSLTSWKEFQDCRHDKGQHINHDKWIVVTSVSSPTVDIQNLSQIEGWKVIIVGDKKTPSNWSHDGCIYLGVEYQQALCYGTAQLLPYASYTRKVLGYLYAIEHGARFIYDTDDDNHPLSSHLQNFDFQNTRTGLVYNSNGTGMNPYAHFGHPSIWPRGYPLEQVAKENDHTYHLCAFNSPAIQQGLVNGDPDVDAIFRLTKTRPSESHLNVTFNDHAPAILLPEGIFAPFNSQNTLFRYEALWAMVLPASVKFRVTDIWRGYWAQRLLWLIGHHLAFFPPNALQLRNPHNYLKDFQEEDQFYLQAGQLVQFLSEWNCSLSTMNLTFFGCVRKLSHDMAIAKFWLPNDAFLIDTWLDDLIAIGYQEPNMIISGTQETCLETFNATNVFFAPKRVDSSPATNIPDLAVFCDNTDLSTARNKRATSFPDVLLVIVFNFPHHGNVQFLDALYRDHFPNILYCSHTATYNDFWAEVAGGPFSWKSPRMPLSFVNVSESYGYFGYECAIRAMEMNYTVEGYLILGDDVLFNFWNFHKLQKLEIPLLQASGVNYLNRFDQQKSGWQWWGTKMGQEAVNAAFDEILNTTEESFLRFFQNRRSKNTSDAMVPVGLSDFYYVPQWATNMFIQVGSALLKHEVFLEIAVPTLLFGLVNESMTEGIEQFSGESVWGNDRNNPFTFYNSTKHFLHPVKPSILFTSSHVRKSFCQTYIQDLIHNW